MLGCPPLWHNANEVRVEAENGAKRPNKMTCLFGQGWRIKMVTGGSLLDCWIKMNWLFGQGWRICRVTGDSLDRWIKMNCLIRQGWKICQVTGGSLEMEATVVG